MTYKICLTKQNQRINYQLYGPPISYDILFARFIGNSIRYFTYNSLSNLYYGYYIYDPSTAINYTYPQYEIPLFIN